MKKSMKKKGLAVGLAATLAVSTMMPGLSFAAEKGIGEKTYEQLERFNLKLGDVKTSQLTKGEEKAFAENQLVVKYTSPITSSEHRKAGGKLLKRFSTLGYDVIEVQGKRELQEVAQAYAALPNVTSISRSAYVKRLGAVDPKTSDMYHLKNLNVAKAQSLAGKNKVKVAVIDTGVDASHPELKNQIIANKNAMDPVKKGLADSHGTHVAGIIAAEKNNGIGGYGIAPNADIISIDVFNRAMTVTDYTIAEGILEAIRQKADVINMSLGSYASSPLLKEAVKKAVDSGIVVVAAAGNDGADILNYPASYEGVISVGATNASNQLAYFSTYGPSVDVVAPGDQVYSSVFDAGKGSSFVNMSGTSMASPVVAGAAALLLSKHPDLTPYQVNYILTKTAKDLGTKGYDTKYGHGQIDLEKMLSFDPKKIPADPAVKGADILSKAKDLGSFETATEASGKFVKLNQEDLYKVELNKDEYLDVTLEGSSKYDLKFELQFFKDGAKTPDSVLEVNDAAQGSTEGTLFKAPENGTLVVKVKDSYGNYNEAGQSAYKLSLGKSLALPEDTNTYETPEVIESLPFESGLVNYYTDESLLAGEDSESADEEMEYAEEAMPGDSDYFRFTIPGNEEDGMKMVKIDLSDVPGIDPTIILHTIENMDGEEYQYEMDSAMDNGFGKGETLSFSAYPGEEFVAEVTNKSYYFDPIMILLGGGMEMDLNRSFSSQTPYELSLDIQDVTADEDGIPDLIGMSPEDMLFEGDFAGFEEAKKELRSKALSSSYKIASEEEAEVDEYSQMIMDAAIPFAENEANTGYLQTMGDEDWYAFTPEQSGLFDVKMDTTNGYAPTGMDIVKYDKESQGFTYVYSNASFSLTSMSINDQFSVGLQAGETYYFVAIDQNYRAKFDPYRFTVKPLVKNVADQFETNDTFEDAVKVTTKAITGNYASVGDIDMYYFKPGKESVYNVSVKPGTIPAKYKNVPTIHKSDIDPILAVIEDTNGNGKMDLEEQANMTLVDSAMYNEEERISFRSKKNAGYFFLTADYTGTNSPVVPYVFNIDEVKQKDEDSTSVVKNNIPSKPIALNRPAKDRYYAYGYMNMTANKPDTDYYKLSLSKNSKLTLSLELPSDLDGKVTVYNAKGQSVATADYYGKGDAESLPLNLKKGTYYIKVEDVQGGASSQPYKLILK
ncbi:S8 family serine peptidase [Cytobacillus gottheilii]|uniref:S8 family serine peptidase n=1 Tax=Cytobacillus gottheilii TaxID=859144 RepID=UPI002494458F|nr:S8 family serine peptidase [Cytobacillus gottheilii]